MQHPMPEHHEVLLKALLRLNEEDSLPPAVEDLYNELRRAMRICGAFVNENQLILIPILLNRVERPEAESFLDTVAANLVARDELVVAKWRGKWQFGRYISTDVKRKKVRVVLEDETGEEREIAAGEVRLPTAGECEVMGVAK